MAKKDATYFIVEFTNRSWQVSKFLTVEQEKPDARYMVEQDQHYGFLCNCPKWLKRKTVDCRHTEMVRDWIAGGKPVPYSKVM